MRENRPHTEKEKAVKRIQEKEKEAKKCSNIHIIWVSKKKTKAHETEKKIFNNNLRKYA